MIETNCDWANRSPKCQFDRKTNPAVLPLRAYEASQTSAFI